MAGPPKTRGMFQYVFKHFKESFKVGKRQKVGTVMGKDPYGNHYYELPAQPQLGKRRPTRWYDTAATDAKVGPGMLDTTAGFDTNIPSEWESWLRHRRADPPSEKEVHQVHPTSSITFSSSTSTSFTFSTSSTPPQSLALAQLKKVNAARLEEERREEMEGAGLDPSPPQIQVTRGSMPWTMDHGP